jgi:heptosyltransferase-2
LRTGKFDLALVLPNSPRSALEVFLAGIPQRIGYARPWRNFFLTQTVTPRAVAVKMRKRSVAEIKNLISHLPISSSQLPNSAHQIHEYLHLAAALGTNAEPLPPQLFVAPEEIEAAKKKFDLEKNDQPIIGLNPGAEYGPAKRWPVEKFIAAAKEISAADKLHLAAIRRQERRHNHKPNRLPTSICQLPASKSGRQNFPPRTHGAPETLPRAFDE